MSDAVTAPAGLPAGMSGYPPGGPPAPGHRTLNEILRDAIRAALAGQAGRLPALRAEYDAAAATLFTMLTESEITRRDAPRTRSAP